MDERTSPEEFGLLFKRFLDDIVNRAEVPEGPLLKRLREHLGGEPTRMPVISEEFQRFEQPNLQIAMDAYLERPGTTAELIGLAAENKRNWGLGLSDFVSRGTSPYSLRLAEGPVDWVNFHLDGDRVLPVVQFGLYLMRVDGAPLIAFVSGPNDNMGPGRARARIEVMAADRAVAQRFISDITNLMGERNVYRGKIVSLGGQQFGFGPQTIITFHRLPAVARDDVILPGGVLERIDRHAISFSEHAQQLTAAGRPVKRGLLLYGAPGTGKTLTIMYLAGRMKGRTVLLTTGRGLGFISSVAQMARILAPSTVVVEDVDLIAQERGMPGVQRSPFSSSCSTRWTAFATTSTSSSCSRRTALTSSSPRWRRGRAGSISRYRSPARRRRSPPPFRAVRARARLPGQGSRQVHCPHRGREPRVYQGAPAQGCGLRRDRGRRRHQDRSRDRQAAR